MNKFIPDQNNEHKSLIKIKNIIPHSENNTTSPPSPSLSKKKKRVLPRWITDLPKNQNENITPTKPPSTTSKKKRVLPRWLTDLPKKSGGGVVKQLKSNSKLNKKNTNIENTNLENIKKSLSTNEKKTVNKIDI